MHVKRFLCAIALCAVALTACGSPEKGESGAETETVSDNENENKDTEDTDAEPETEQEEASWIDFDHMTFTLCGTEYTFGETTLAELIEDGIPFDEDGLLDIYETLAADSISGMYEITLDSDTNLECYLTVINDTELPVAYADCTICSLEVETEMLSEQSVLELPFPVDMTKEDLVENAGNPDDSDTYYADDEVRIDTYTYKKASEVYTSYSSYEFEFTDGVLTNISITWIP